MNYPLACAIGFHLCEDAAEDRRSWKSPRSRGGASPAHPGCRRPRGGGGFLEWEITDVEPSRFRLPKSFELTSTSTSTGTA